MATVERVFPTRWPLFELFIAIWALRLGFEVLSPSVDMMGYQYVGFRIMWGTKDLIRFRIYDAYQRRQDRLRELTSKGTGYTLVELKAIRDIAEENIKKYEKGIL